MVVMQITQNPPADRLSRGLTEFFDSLSAEDRASLVGILRDTNTYLAEDMSDVMSILQALDD
jgi:hypothetical protein